MLVAAMVLVLHAAPFEEATDAWGLAGVGGDRFTFADLDADGDPDLIVAGRRLFWNRDGRFVEAPGALKGARGSSAACADLDGDGRLDVVTLGGDLFLQKKPGAFTRTELDFPERQASFGIGDLDGDGRPDILTGGGELWKDNRSHLYPRRALLNRGGGKFEDATEKLGLTSKRYGRSVVFCDFDDDGDADCYIGNYRLAPNELWRRGPDGLSDSGWARGRKLEHSNSGPCYGHTIGASWADLDGDGWFDLWVSNLVHKYVGPWTGSLKDMEGSDIRGYICDDSNLFRNRGAPDFGFEDRRKESGIPLRPIGGRGKYRGDELWSNCAVADYDNDGDLDVFVTQVYKLLYAHSYLFENQGGFRFRPVDTGFKVFNSYGAAWADVDGDGRMDLITGGALNEPGGPKSVRLWRNTTEGGTWVGFRFPKPALGAIVRVVTKTRVHARLSEATMGSHAQANSDILHVGLGGEKIEEVRVSWPDGTEQRLRNVVPGKVYAVERPKRKPPKRVELASLEGELRVRPKLSGATYHWDVDDDFRTDQVTKQPKLALKDRKGSVSVRVFRGDVGRHARITLP